MNDKNSPDSPSFAERMGFGDSGKVYAPDDYLPERVRKRVCDLIVRHYDGLTGMERRIVEVIKTSLLSTEELYEWSTSANYLPDELTRPLLDCEWYLFYTAIERFCADWDRTGSSRSSKFAKDFNFLTDSHSIPWSIQGGWVVPASIFGSTDDLDDLRAALNASTEPLAPHLMLKRAVDAVNIKDREPDCAAACTHAWGAWKAAVAMASGEDGDWKRAFGWLKQHYPEVNETMNLWRCRVNDGRHPEYDQVPDLESARFIVMLCVGAVRLLSAHFDSAA